MCHLCSAVSVMCVKLASFTCWHIIPWLPYRRVAQRRRFLGSSKHLMGYPRQIEVGHQISKALAHIEFGSVQERPVSAKESETPRKALVV